jgi:hypothetical protein
MTEPVPTDPAAFFSAYLPERARALEAKLDGVTSVGSVTFRVPETGEWSLRLFDGKLETTTGSDADVMIQVTIPLADFPILISEPLERLGVANTTAGVAGPLRALAAKPETARLIRHVPGSVLFVVRDGDVKRRLLITPGRRVANLESAECTIECTLSDLIDSQTRGVSPMQLFVAGKLRLSGNVQIAMALSGIFA